MIDLFIERMTVLSRGLIFQPVLVIHTCTYSNNNITTLQNIDITDFPSPPKKEKRKIKTEISYLTVVAWTQVTRWTGVYVWRTVRCPRAETDRCQG